MIELLQSMFEDFGKSIQEQQKHSEAYDTPLHVIEAMWQVKWGDEWVDVDEIRSDPFWTSAFVRLTTNNLTESHRIITAPDGNSGLVYRLKKND